MSHHKITISRSNPAQKHTSLYHHSCQHHLQELICEELSVGKKAVHTSAAVPHSSLCCSEDVVATSGPCFLGNSDKPHVYLEPGSATQRSAENTTRQIIISHSSCSAFYAYCSRALNAVVLCLPFKASSLSLHGQVQKEAESVRNCDLKICFMYLLMSHWAKAYVISKESSSGHSFYLFPNPAVFWLSGTHRIAIRCMPNTLCTIV